ncbi:hypothetical protein ENUP19_0343G0010 [Entamoeba nuttalli]|uniref:Uncharacterized protein n=2 Tax=Entamoeba nuttalli TaxID=412467 RepID=A0ABQ0DF32_9EUKA
MSELNNLTHQLLLLKNKLSKLENKNTQEEKKKEEINYNIIDSFESQIVNEIAYNVVVVDEISSSEDDFSKKKANAEKDNEIKEMISKMNKKEEIEEIEEFEVMKIFKEEEKKEQEDVQFINYYYNKKKVHQIINIINKYEIIINTLDDYYHYIKSVASIINIINKNKEERS